MLKNISLDFSEAKNKLTRLGLSLYYFYLFLILAGAAGLVFGVISFILKFFGVGAAVNTSWVEVVALTVLSGLMIRFFVWQSLALLRPDVVREEVIAHEGPEEIPKEVVENVIPFRRKAGW